MAVTVKEQYSKRWFPWLQEEPRVVGQFPTRDEALKYIKESLAHDQRFEYTISECLTED